MRYQSPRFLIDNNLKIFTLDFNHDSLMTSIWLTRAAPHAREKALGTRLGNGPCGEGGGENLTLYVLVSGCCCECQETPGCSSQTSRFIFTSYCNH